MRRTAPLVALFLSALGCAKAAQPGQTACDRRSICGDQEGPTPGNRGYCAEALADPVCAPTYVIALACVQKKEACTTDGHRDVPATDGACAAEIAAALLTPACLAIVGQDAGGPSDDGGTPDVSEASAPLPPTEVRDRANSLVCRGGLVACVHSCGEVQTTEPNAARCSEGLYSCDDGLLPALACPAGSWPPFNGSEGCGPWVANYDCSSTCLACLDGFWDCHPCPDAGVP